MAGLSELLPEDIVKKIVEQKGGSAWLSNFDDYVNKAALGGVVFGGRKIPGADENVRRLNALLEMLGNRYLPEQLGIENGGLLYKGDNYNVSANPSRVQLQNKLPLGGQLNVEVERTSSVKDMLDNLGFNIRANWKF
tara:strand:- start:8501 stop:8911 length:411 start_codon:yes stop_codon:yes gene_type:complete